MAVSMACLLQRMDEKAGILHTPCTVLFQIRAFLHGTVPEQDATGSSPHPPSSVAKHSAGCTRDASGFLPALLYPTANTPRTKRQERNAPITGLLNRKSPKPGEPRLPALFGFSSTRHLEHE